MTIVEIGKENLKSKEYHYTCPICNCHFLYRKSDIKDSSYLNCPWCDNKIGSIDLFCEAHCITPDEFIKKVKQIRDITGCSIINCKKALIQINSWDDNTDKNAIKYLRAGC